MLKKGIFSVILLSLISFSTFVLIEVSLSVFLSNPSALKRLGLLDSLKPYYMRWDRKVIQNVAECAQYDGELAYTLKPGGCSLQSREFDIDYNVNSLGVRDDEKSLVAPQIVVLGDSHAMGWGVEQDQIFSERMERDLNKTVLNVAISSYGTARQMALLERVDVSKLELLVIQYCDNDFRENDVFFNENGKLPIMSKDKFEEVIAKHKRETDYYFGKHSRLVYNSLLFRYKNKDAKNLAGPKTDNSELEADRFLNAVYEGLGDDWTVPVLVIEVNGQAKNTPDFVNAVNLLLDEGSAKINAGSIKTIDISGDLSAAEYFTLDDHMNLRGHQLVAERLVVAANAMLQ